MSGVTGPPTLAIHQGGWIVTKYPPRPWLRLWSHRDLARTEGWENWNERTRPVSRTRPRIHMSKGRNPHRLSENDSIVFCLREPTQMSPSRGTSLPHSLFENDRESAGISLVFADLVWYLPCPRCFRFDLSFHFSGFPVILIWKNDNFRQISSPKALHVTRKLV